MSQFNPLKGVGVALVTPFENHKIDFKSLDKLLNHNTYNDYWVVNGTTGESPTLNLEEKNQLLEYVKKFKSSHQKPQALVYGIGGNNTQEVLYTLKNTDLQGVDAILSSSPAYNKPTQKGIIAHYTQIADQSPVPVILYNVPGRTASNISATTTLSLAQHPNIIGIKEASGDLLQSMRITAQKPHDFLLISGDDLLTLPLISIGACGVISVLANAFPLFTDMVHQALEGQYDQAAQKAYQLLDLNHLMYEEGNPVGIKKALDLLGICRSQVRMPLIEASEELSLRIQKEIEKLKNV